MFLEKKSSFLFLSYDNLRISAKKYHYNYKKYNTNVWQAYVGEKIVELVNIFVQVGFLENQ